MATYEFRCPQCSVFEATYSMSEVPDTMICPTCQSKANRRISVPNISHARSASFKLVDSTKRSAHEPEVITSAHPGQRSGPGQRYTANPLHQRLPRA